MSLAHLQGKRVLVIDDSDAMRSQMQQNFSGTGWHRVGDGAEYPSST